MRTTNYSNKSEKYLLNIEAHWICRNVLEKHEFVSMFTAFHATSEAFPFLPQLLVLYFVLFAGPIPLKLTTDTQIT